MPGHMSPKTGGVWNRPVPVLAANALASFKFALSLSPVFTKNLRSKSPATGTKPSIANMSYVDARIRRRAVPPSGHSSTSRPKTPAAVLETLMQHVCRCTIAPLQRTRSRRDNKSEIRAPISRNTKAKLHSL